jgi:hypothetical protein
VDRLHNKSGPVRAVDHQIFTVGRGEEFIVQDLAFRHASRYPRLRDPTEVIELVGLADRANARTTSLSRAASVLA